MDSGFFAQTFDRSLLNYMLFLRVFVSTLLAARFFVRLSHCCIKNGQVLEAESSVAEKKAALCENKFVCIERHGLFFPRSTWYNYSMFTVFQTRGT